MDFLFNSWNWINASKYTSSYEYFFSFEIKSSRNKFSAFYYEIWQDIYKNRVLYFKRCSIRGIWITNSQEFNLDPLKNYVRFWVRRGYTKIWKNFSHKLGTSFKSLRAQIFKYDAILINRESFFREKILYNFIVSNF